MRFRIQREKNLLKSVKNGAKNIIAAI